MLKFETFRRPQRSCKSFVGCTLFFLLVNWLKISIFFATVVTDRQVLELFGGSHCPRYCWGWRPVTVDGKLIFYDDLVVRVGFRHIIITFNLSKLLTILLGSEKHNVSFSNSLLLLILKVKKELHAIMLHLIFCSFHFFISLAFCWQIMSQHDSFVLSPGFSGAQNIRVKKVTMHSAQLPRWHFKTRIIRTK